MGENSIEIHQAPSSVSERGEGFRVPMFHSPYIPWLPFLLSCPRPKVRSTANSKLALQAQTVEFSVVPLTSESLPKKSGFALQSDMICFSTTC